AAQLSVAVRDDVRDPALNGAKPPDAHPVPAALDPRFHLPETGTPGAAFLFHAQGLSAVPRETEFDEDARLRFVFRQEHALPPLRMTPDPFEKGAPVFLQNPV